MRMIKKGWARILTALLVAAVVVGFTPQMVAPAYAEDGTPVISTYYVRFDSNVPSNASTVCKGSMDDQIFTSDERKPLSGNSFSLPGYEFVCWNTKADGTGTSYADQEEVKALSAYGSTVTLYAQWDAKSYSIIFNGGEIGGVHVQTAYFDQPGTLDPYSDEAFGWNSEGRTLRGWAGTGFKTFYSDGASFVNLCGAPGSDGELHDRELVALWVQNGQIVVTITKDNVPQEMMADSFELVGSDGTKFSVPIYYERGAYTFDASHAVQPGSTPAPLPDGEYDLVFNNSNYPLASERITYRADSASNVVFDYYTVGLEEDPDYADFCVVQIDGGKPIPGEDGVVALNGDKLNISTSVDEGFIFTGYTADGIAPIWGDGDPTQEVQDIQVRGMTNITAHIKLKPTLTITAKDQTYTYNGQTQGEGDTVYDDPAQIAEKITVEGLQGKDYIGNVTLDGQGKDVGVYDGELVPSNAVIYNNAGYNVTKNYFIEYVNGTLTIEPIIYTVTFMDGQGKTLKTEKVESGKAATAPAAPKRSGYTFTGWDKDFSKVTADLTVTAKWKKNAEPAPATKVSGTLLAKMTAKGSKSLVLTWSKVKCAEGYDIFFIKCGKDAPKKVKTIKGNKTFKWTKSGLKKGKAYKAVVKAYVMKNGKKTYVKTSPMVHAYTSGGTKNYTNSKSVTVKKTSVSLKAGKTYKIKASVTKLQKGKKLMPTGHAPKLRYVSSNKKIATVSKSGKITAKSKGSCKVYVIAVNGARKAVAVTVK